MDTKHMIEKDEALLKDIFELYDTTGNDKIKVSFLGECLRAAGLNPTQAEVRKVEKDFGKEFVAFDEFLPIYNSVLQRGSTSDKKISSDAVIDCFKHFDRNESGVMPSVMLRHILASLGERMSDEEIDLLFTGYVNKQGDIDYELLVKEILLIEN